MTASAPQFAVATDGGTDFFPQLHHDSPLAPLSLTFGNDTRKVNEVDRDWFLQQLATNSAHPTTSQPTPQDWAQALEKAHQGSLPVLAISISAGLSGSIASLQQALALVPHIPVTIHDSRTLSGAQAMQVHVAEEAARRGMSMDAALEWVRQTYQESELYFTIETLEYLRRGGRIGRVMATLGGLLNLKPLITVDKQEAIYTNLSRTRSYKGAIDAIAAQITKRFGEGTPLRTALMYGDHPEDAEYLLGKIKEQHPVIWSDIVPVNPVLMVHTGPRTVGLGVASGDWVWNR